METVLITGASRGIGLELTKQFLAGGYHVIATYRGEKPPESLISLETADSSRLVLYSLEVTEGESLSALASQLENSVIDIVINNAGIIGPNKQSLKEIDTVGWLKAFAVNTVAPFNVSRSLLPNLTGSAHPRIITISSQMGSLNRVSTGMFAYQSSKAAVNKVMQVLALELKDAKIIVCPIHPGWVRTEMGGPNADISVEESARGIMTLTENLTMEQTGLFLNWRGEKHEW